MRTLVSLTGHAGEKTAMWIESKKKISLEPIGHGFGYAGHPTWTNSGMYFSKKELQSIIDTMEDEDRLSVAAMTYPQESTFEKIIEKFERDNY